MLTALVLILFFQTFLRQPTATWLTATLAGLALLSAFRPFEGLLVFAAAGPLSTVIYSWGRGAGGNSVFAEAIALAFLTGWTVRQAIIAEPLRVAASVRWPAILLALLAVTSGIVHWFGIPAESPREDVRALLEWYVLRDYPLRTPGVEPIAAAVVFFSGVLLLLAAAHLCAEQPGRRIRALVAMVAAAAIAASFNIRRIVEIALRAERPLSAFGEHLLHTRVSVNYADKNAAGSYFALTTLLAAGLLRNWIALAVLCAALTSAALWLTGSRMAFAATSITVAALALVTLRTATNVARRLAAGAVVVLLLAGTAALFVWYPEGRNLAASSALAVRVGLWRAGLEMAADYPIFGVGLGRFYHHSSRYAQDTLTTYGFTNENAHNNFIQILAELGIPGLVAFVVLVFAALSLAYRHERPRPLHVTALGAGIVAYLLSALGGHPFVVPDATYPFWLALGLTAASTTPVVATGTHARTVIAVLVIAILASTPWRARNAILHADLSDESVGFSNWRGGGEDWRYRFMGGRATFYAPAAASAIQLQMRGGLVVRRPFEVTAFVEGREVNRVLLPADDQWRTLRFLIRKPKSGASYVRVDLVAAEPGQDPYPQQATADSGVVLVRSPVYEGMER